MDRLAKDIRDTILSAMTGRVDTSDLSTEGLRFAVMANPGLARQFAATCRSVELDVHGESKSTTIIIVEDVALCFDDDGWASFLARKDFP